MKFLENEFFKEIDISPNCIYVIGYSKKGWLGYYQEGTFYAIMKNKKHLKLKNEEAKFLIKTEFNVSDIDAAYEKYDKEFFTNLKREILGERISYSCVLLDKKSVETLEEGFKDLIPEDWLFVAHHMTLCLGSLLDDSKELIGLNKELKVVSYSIDYEKKILAAKVETDLDSTSAYTHITVAKFSGVASELSNTLESFITIDSFKVSGVVTELKIKNTNKIY